MVITRVAPLSCAKVAGILYAVMGLVGGALISLFALVGGFAAGQMDGGGPFAYMGALFGVGAIILFPICYGLLGFIMVLIMTWLFNIASGMVGGIEMDVQ